MWGFTILLLTIIEAYGDLFDKYFHIPGIGTMGWLGFVEDFFACAVLVALVTFSIIRLIQNAAAGWSASPASTARTPARPGSSSS